jgi:hypothetical protein
MKRQLAIVGIGLVALSCAGLAVAKGIDHNSTATAVAGTFTATTATGKTDTRTCTTTDGKTITTTHGTFTGASSGAADFTGPITIDSHSVINTTDNVGLVDSHVRIDASAGKTDLHFTGVYDGGNVAGLATGHAATHGINVIGNVSAGFSTTTGFSSGKIGGGTSGGSAVLVGPGRCAPNKPPHENSEAQGTVTAVSPTSITVAGLQCTVPPNLAAAVGAFQVNDRAHIRCTLVANVNTLDRIDPKHKH